MQSSELVDVLGDNALIYLDLYVLGDDALIYLDSYVLGDDALIR